MDDVNRGGLGWHRVPPSYVAFARIYIYIYTYIFTAFIQTILIITMFIITVFIYLIPKLPDDFR